MNAKLKKYYVLMKMTALVAVIFALAGIGSLAFANIYFEHITLANIQNSLDQTNIILTNITTLTKNLKDQTDQTAIILKSVNKLVINARVATDNANKAAIGQRLWFETNLPKINEKILTILDRTDQNLKDADKNQNLVTSHINDNLSTSNKMLQNTEKITNQLNNTMVDLNNKLQSDNAKQIAQNLVEISKNLNSTSQNLNTTSSEIKSNIHSLSKLNPFNWFKKKK